MQENLSLTEDIGAAEKVLRQRDTDPEWAKVWKVGCKKRQCMGECGV